MAKEKMAVDWGAVSAQLPTGKDPLSKKRRQDLFSKMDPNGNKYFPDRRAHTNRQAEFRMRSFSAWRKISSLKKTAFLLRVTLCVVGAGCYRSRRLTAAC